MPEELAPEEGIGIVSAADPVGDETAAGADPAPTPQTEPAAPLAAPEPAQPSTAKPFDWQSVDLRRVDPLTVPREHRAAVEAAQKQVRAVQGDGTRQFDDLSRRERALGSIDGCKLRMLFKLGRWHGCRRDRRILTTSTTTSTLPPIEIRRPAEYRIGITVVHRHVQLLNQVKLPGKDLRHLLPGS